MTQLPTTQLPTTQLPTTQLPTTQLPTTQLPTTQLPTTQLPTTQLPTVAESPRVVSDHPAGGEVVGREVVGGVDTHKDTHTAAAIDERGRLLGCEQFPATPRGYQDLLAWLRGHAGDHAGDHTGGHTGGNGRLVLVGVEGTGAYGAGLTRLLLAEQVQVVEVDRPDRKTRRRQGKSDPIDAIAAAQAAQSGRATGRPKHRHGRVEALRALRVARRSAIDQRADVQRQIKALVVTAPEPLRGQLRTLSTHKLIAHCASRRPDTSAITGPAADRAAHAATVLALRSLARRHQQLSAEIRELDTLITPLIETINPRLLAVFGVGPDTAGQLLVTAGDNPDRITTEAAFAMLCGAAPLPASSGQTHRHRLNRGGDRQANAALYRIVLSRLRHDPATRAYATRRAAENKTKKEIIRCLKRYVAREIYRILTASNDLEIAA
jgi:transposase